MNRQIATYIGICITVCGIAVFGYTLQKQRNIVNLVSNQCCEEEQLSNFNLEFKRTACLGSCPIYSVNIDSTGKALISGYAHVGFKEIKIDLNRDQLTEIAKLTYAADFYEIDDIYSQGKAGCRSYSTDSPNSVWAVTSGDLSNSVNYYYGCANASSIIPLMEKTLISYLGIDKHL